MSKIFSNKLNEEREDASAVVKRHRQEQTEKEMTIGSLQKRKESSEMTLEELRILHPAAGPCKARNSSCDDITSVAKERIIRTKAFMKIREAKIGEERVNVKE